MTTPTDTTTFDALYFRRLFEATTEDQWCERVRTDPEGRHCALGFCDPLDGTPDDGGNGPRAKALHALFEDRDYRFFTVVRINNGDDERYPQPTPRARMLAALDDLIAGTVPAPIHSTL